MHDVVVVDSIRTGLAKSFRGSFNLTRSDDMVAHCIDTLLERNPSVAPEEVEDVVVGAANHSGEQGGNLARLAVVLSKLPITTAGLSINRFCSSGLQSIAIVANQIQSGQTQIGIGGGVDSISMNTRQEAGKFENRSGLPRRPSSSSPCPATGERKGRSSFSCPLTARMLSRIASASNRHTGMCERYRFAGSIRRAALLARDDC